MAKGKQKSVTETRDYRHTGEKRKNIPSAKTGAEGEIPKVKKAQYYYSPHLSPELRFDPTGKVDQVTAIKDKVGQYLTEAERTLLDQALTNQQPWLEWAAKKEQYDRGSFEVDPVALHIHERVSAQAIVRSATREDLQRDLFADPQLPYQKEVQFYQHDVDWANRLVLGDSLQVMSSLARRENLAGKVQMIYMDPPYGIKFRSNFQPRLGQKDVADKEADLTREAEMVKAYRDTWSLGRHSYLSYLRDRFVVARELLAESGSIFIQISHENYSLVHSLLSEVFGTHNVVGTICYVTTSTQGTGLLPIVNDFVVWYSKNAGKAKYHQLYETKIVGEKGSSGYNMIERKTGEVVRIGDARSEEGRLFSPGDLTSSHQSTSAPIEVNGDSYTAGHRYWSTSTEGMIRVREADRMVVVGNSVRFKRYFDDFPVYPLSNLWTDTGVAGFTSDRKMFVVQTNTKVVERCVLMSTDPGDIVLDPTCGGGTTASVAEQWGRRWITIDTSRVSVAIARQRLLTAKYEFFRFRDEKKGVVGGFLCKSVPHVTMKSIAQNRNLDIVFSKHHPVLDEVLATCNGALAQVSDEVREKLRLRLVRKQQHEGGRAVTDADRRRWNLPKQGGKWEHWEVPFDTDQDWPQALQNSVVAYRKAWREKIDAINECIASNTEQEELVDQPEIVKGVVRVSGPFTVEGVHPEELSMGEEGLFDGTPNEWEEDVRDDVQNIRAYLFRMVDLIRKDGVTFPNNTFRKFARVDALFEEKTGTPLHAEGIWEGTDTGEPNNVAIAFGPQYGPVAAQQVEDIIRSSRRYDELVIAGFSFDGEAAVAIQESVHPKLKVHMAHIRPDVSPGMDGLLKDTPNSQLFSVFGQPEVNVKKHGEEEYQVELLGVDIFDPLKGEVRSTGAEKVAAWFLDSDYDGRCFCITQAFFPDQNAWEKIAKALGSQADIEAFQAFEGTVSLPFVPGKHKRIAVKVIDPRGNEVMAFRNLED